MSIPMPIATNTMTHGLPNPNPNSNPNPHSHQHFHSTSSSTATSSNTISTINISKLRDAKFDVVLGVAGGTDNPPFIQEEIDVDWTSSDRLKRMGYLKDADVDIEFDPSQALPRARERGIASSERQEVTLPSTATTITAPTVATTPSPFRSRSVSKGNRAEDISTSTTVQGAGSIDQLSKSRPPPHYKTFWESESAAQREIEDDDYAWYYRNPHRHIWRPRNPSATMRLRVYSRRRIMCGGVEGEEGLPTKMNRMLFLQHVARHHREMAVGTFEAEVVEEKLEEVVKVGRGTGAKKSQAGMQPTTSGDDDVLMNINDDVTLLPMEDWQEELFSPKYAHRRFMRASRASSVETYTSSNHSSSSAPSSSPRISYEMDANGHGSWIANFPGGGGASCSGSKSYFNSSSKERAVGLSQFSFLRVIST